MKPGKTIQYTFLIVTLLACTANEKLPQVETVDLSQTDPTSFAGEEWYMPYYLQHFAAVANSVVAQGEDRGFFDLSVWRGTHNHHTYNARIMEGILSLVWFYCTDRPWNVYYGDPALKKRIEASMLFWCKMQNHDGRFSEYAVGQWGLAPTAFATKFLGRALWLLEKQGPSIDAAIFEQTRASLRKAIYIGFTHEDLWEHGRNYTNQFANLWGGALAYLDAWPDQEIEQLLKERMHESMSAFQSPLGFFYEKGGPDWGYNLGTHHSDLQVAWEYADEEIRGMIIEKTRRWYEWFSYNAVKEPDNMYYYLNRAIETRQRKAYYHNTEIDDPSQQRWVPQAEYIPVARAFEMSDKEYYTSATKHTQEMLNDYPKVSPLELGEFSTFSPYAFLHHNMKMWHPTQEQKDAAINNLPYLKNSSFVKVMRDERSETAYAYVRSPKYYATFNSGKIVTDQQRFGIGLIWTPKTGTLFQSQSGSDEAAWGTKAANSTQVYEAGDLLPELMPAELGVNQPFKSITVKYKLGENGEKSITFNKNSINVAVSHPGSFKEILPILLSADDSISIKDGQVFIQTKDGSLYIETSAKEVLVEDYEVEPGIKKCRVVSVSANSSLNYEFIF